jgi:hypothetical protein
MGQPLSSRASGLFLEIRLWGDGPALRKSPYVRFLSATNISHRIGAGEVCLIGKEVKIPTLFRENKNAKEGWGTLLRLIARS